MANRRFIDFPIAASVGNNDIVLIWQDGLNKQTTKATLLQGSPQSLAGLTDVDIAALTNGQILQYNSTTSKWENVDRTDIFLSQLGDVTIVAPSNGQVLVYNSSTSKWENSSGGFVPYTGAVTTVNLGSQTIQAGSFVKAGGTAAQFLKANGSVDSTAYGTGSVTSVALTMPTAFTVAGSPITTAGTLAVTGAGLVSQYIRGDGSLADFPESSGGGSSISYYLNGSIAQGTIVGVAYKELNKVPILGAGTDFTIAADGYIASFITDAGDPNLLQIPGGNWNFETYFSSSSSGGTPSFYVELYKYDGTNFTLIASNSTFPEFIAFGTIITPYYSTLAVPTTTLALTDRLAIRYYVVHSGRTITLHTEDNHLCQIVTTFTTGLTALNGLTAQVQNFAVGTSGTDFAIASATATHTFNLPTASATNRGALSSADWTTFNGKENAITAGTTLQYFRGDKTFQTLNTAAVPELTNLYYTEARVNANTNVAANTAARHNAVTLGTANGLSLSTQILSLGLASAGVTGALSGTDWTTFNGKQNALTNPVTGTGTTNYLPKFTGSTTIGDSLIYDNGTKVFIGTTTTNSISTGGLTLSNATSSSLVLYNGGIVGFIFGSSIAAGMTVTADKDLRFETGDGSGSNWPERMRLFQLTGNLKLGYGGAPADNGYKLDVNGTGRFSGNVVLGTTALTGGGAAQWLTANGTAYGGGLISSVSGVVKAYYYYDNGANAAMVQAAAGVGVQLWANNTVALSIDSTGVATFSSTLKSNDHEIKNSANSETLDLFLSPSTLNGFIDYPSGRSLTIRNKGSLSTFTLSSTGAATFSSSVLTGGDIFTYNNGGIFFSGAASFTSGIFQNANGLNLQSGGSPRITIPSGGNVLIGTQTNGASKLRIVGLPTSAVGLSSGDVYNLSGVLMIA
jgi:hypothetical protein